MKEGVYLPDWRDEARLAYTNRLADLLAVLLPPGGAEIGSISTVPGAFKPNAQTPEAIDQDRRPADPARRAPRRD